jgi:hypothetical protein
MRWIMALCLLGFAAPAYAGATDRLVKIKAGPKRYFQDGDRSGCPGAAQCRRRGYVMPGDMLIESSARGGFSFVTYVPKGGGKATTGWIESAALVPVPLNAPRAADWIGAWVGPDDSNMDITLGGKAGIVHVEGEALWGQYDPEKVKRGSVHVGQISGDMTPLGLTALYRDGEGEYDCRVDLRLLGPYLLVEDNGNCGGASVTFNGVYRR